MLFLSTVAWRYMTSNIAQTVLLVLGVALSVVVFVFITALINGLTVFLTAEVTSKIAHVELEPPNTISRILTDDDRFVAAPVSTFRRKQIRNWQQILEVAENSPGVTVVSPTIDGNAFLVRGEAVLPISVQGTVPDKVDAIADLSSSLIEGSSDLSSGGLMIGAELAEELNLKVGIPVLMRTERGAERLVPITGIFKSGVSTLDRRVAYISIGAARPLFDLPNGVTKLSLKLKDPDTAPSIANALQDATGLKATPWQEKNKTLKDATDAQERTGTDPELCDDRHHHFHRQRPAPVQLSSARRNWHHAGHGNFSQLCRRRVCPARYPDRFHRRSPGFGTGLSTLFTSGISQKGRR